MYTDEYKKFNNICYAYAITFYIFMNAKFGLYKFFYDQLKIRPIHFLLRYTLYHTYDNNKIQ